MSSPRGGFGARGKAMYGRWLSACLALLLLSGCMSVQEIRDQRIARNAPLFDGFPANVQQMVRDGVIDVGFTRDMVRLAWGEPHEVFTRASEAGTTNIWYYLRPRVRSGSDFMLTPIYYLDSAGNARLTLRSVWYDRDSVEYYTAARVEFSGSGIVLAIERLRE
ncbi:MAG: hypothetical protein AB2807_00160 [Candidatus Sedimenticola endophacoides]